MQQNSNYLRQLLILLAYLHIVEELEVISHKLHLERYPNWRQCDTESRRTASALLAGIATFEFFIVWATVARLLRCPTKKIQGRSLDLLDVVGQVEFFCEDLAFIRNDGAKKHFSRCFEYAAEMASLIDSTESDTSFNYHRKNMCLPFLDHLINGTDVRFDKYDKTVLMTQALIPSVIAETDMNINEIVEIYKYNLPAPNNSQEEFIRWKRRWSVPDISERP